MRNMDDIALSSPLRYKNTTLKVVLVGFALLVGLLSSSPVPPFFIMICMVLSTLIFGKIPLDVYFKLFLSTLGFVAVSCIILAFFSLGGSGDILLAFLSSVGNLRLRQEVPTKRF
jgi:hypothetical protein